MATQLILSQTVGPRQTGLSRKRAYRGKKLKANQLKALFNVCGVYPQFFYLYLWPNQEQVKNNHYL